MIHIKELEGKDVVQIYHSLTLNNKWNLEHSLVLQNTSLPRKSKNFLEKMHPSLHHLHLNNQLYMQNGSILLHHVVKGHNQASPLALLGNYRSIQRYKLFVEHV